MPAVAERLRRTYPAPPERASVGSIPAKLAALTPTHKNVPSFRRWRFEMKLSPFCAIIHSITDTVTYTIS